MAPQKDPIVLQPLKSSSDASLANSTIIFLHGLGDDGRGTGYGLAQQFQSHEKLTTTKWVLPTADLDRDVGERCWYKPHSLGHNEQSAEQVDEGEDEAGILKTVDYIDSLIAAEVDSGTNPSKIVVGGFSQGCAVSTVWGLKGQWRDKVAGVFGLSGYFPQIPSVMSPGSSDGADGTKVTAKWFFAHGLADRLLSTSLFAEGQRNMQRHVARENIEGHVYEDMGHDIGGAEIRDLWLWLKMVLQEE